jgi:hypothetical protein
MLTAGAAWGQQCTDSGQGAVDEYCELIPFPKREENALTVAQGRADESVRGLLPGRTARALRGEGEDRRSLRRLLAASAARSSAAEGRRARSGRSPGERTESGARRDEQTFAEALVAAGETAVSRPLLVGVLLVLLVAGLLTAWRRPRRSSQDG